MWPQRLGIVASNSYGVIVKPRQRILLNVISKEALSEHTINLIIVFHESKGIEINVAMKVDVRPEGQKLAFN